MLNYLYVLILWGFLITRGQTGSLNETVSTCSDKSPYCNNNDCVTRPGYALEYCKKTCGNCQHFCQESQYVSCNLTAKADCEFMLRDYCPIMCNMCRPMTKKKVKVIIPTTTTMTPPPKDNILPIDELSIASLETANSESLLQNNSLMFLENHLDDNTLLNNIPLQQPSPPQITSLSAEESKNKFLNVRRSDYHPKASRPRAYSVYNSGKQQTFNPTTEKVNIKSVPLMANFRNQIIFPPPSKIRKMPAYRGQVYPSNYYYPPQQPYLQQLPSQPQINQMTTLYPPYPIDYGDVGFYAATKPPIPPMPPVQPVPISLLSAKLFRRPQPSISLPPATQAPPIMYPMPVEPPSRPIPPQYYNQNYYFPRRAQPSTTPTPPSMIDYDVIDTDMEPDEQPMYAESIPPSNNEAKEPKEKPAKSKMSNSGAIADLVTLLGCRDKDPIVCSKVTEESCRARPGFYLKLCKHKCRNCNGLACFDSNKIDCSDLQQRGGCRLAMAQEYCPKTCNTCSTPHFIAEQQSPCKDELDTCDQLVESGVCDHPFSKATLRIWCAKSCGYCKASQFYMNDYFDIPKSFNIYPTLESMN